LCPHAASKSSRILALRDKNSTGKRAVYFSGDVTSIHPKQIPENKKPLSVFPKGVLISEQL